MLKIHMTKRVSISGFLCACIILLAVDPCLSATALSGPGTSAYDNIDQLNSSNRTLDGAAMKAEREMFQNSLIHPPPDKLKTWIDRFNKAPQTPINATISKSIDNLDGSSKSLLSHVSYVPSERNQGSCGDCWAWAGTGVIEIEMDVESKCLDRLSVQYINSKLRDGTGSFWACCGGWLTDVAAVYNQVKFVVPWSNTNANWRDGSKTCSSGPTSVPWTSISTNPNYPISSMTEQAVPTQSVSKATAISNIKNVLNQNKGVWFAVFLPTYEDWDTFFDFWYSNPETAIWNPDTGCGKSAPAEGAAGHAMLIVGYDDTDPNNPYWLVLNSWATAGGARPNGLLRMDMNMNYACQYKQGDYFLYSYYFETMDVSFAMPTNPTRPSGPDSGVPGAYYSYSTSSTDPHGHQIRYVIDWGDGQTTETELVDSGVVVTREHSWSTGGDFKIQARAFDSTNGASGWSETKAVTIGENHRPTTPGTPVGPGSGTSGTQYTYSTSSTDPDGDKIKYLFEWGDGTSDETDYYDSGVSASLGHSWSGEGTYQVRAKATDTKGAVSDWSNIKTVQIAGSQHPPEKPSTPSGPSAGVVGRSYKYSTSAVDPDGNKVKYTFEWGDGSTSETDYFDSGVTVSMDNIWGTPGTYQISVKATDTKGAISEQSDKKTVTITANRPPTKPSAIAGPGSGKPGLEYDFSTSSTDPDGDRIKYIFDWYDGTTTETDYYDSGQTVTAEHSWSEENRYLIRAMAVDVDGAVSEWSTEKTFLVSIDRNYDGMGLFRPTNHKFYLDYDNDGIVDNIVDFGKCPDLPVTGDWDGDGFDGIGVFRKVDRTFYLDDDLDGQADKTIKFGTSVDIPVAADWNADGIDEIGVFRPFTRSFYLDTKGDGTIGLVIRMGQIDDRPIAGDWNGDGKGEVALFRPSTHTFYVDLNNDGKPEVIFQMGKGIDRPVKADWDGDGSDEIGIFGPLDHKFRLDEEFDNDEDFTLSLGRGTDLPISGRFE